MGMGPEWGFRIDNHSMVSCRALLCLAARLGREATRDEDPRVVF